jgi:Rrf2 family protein
MDSFSSRTFHAVEAVLYIALKTTTEPVRSREICVYQNVAVRYLEPLLQKLVHAQILRGVRGPKGGYLLARERRKITLSDIMEAVHPTSGKIDLQQSNLHQQVIAPIWQESKKFILQQYSEISLADLCQRAVASGINIEAEKKSDFNI